MFGSINCEMCFVIVVVFPIGFMLSFRLLYMCVLYVVGCTCVVVCVCGCCNSLKRRNDNDNEKRKNDNDDDWRSIRN